MNILPDFPDQSAPRPAPAPQPRKRRLRNFLLGATGLLVLMLAALVLTAVFFPVDALKGQLIKAIEGQTGYRCEIEGLSSNTLGGSLTLRGLRLSDPTRPLATPLLQIQEANLLVALTSLPGIFSGKPVVVEKITIGGGLFNCALFEPPAARTAAGATPLPPSDAAQPAPRPDSAAAGAAPAGKADAARFTVKRLAIREFEVYSRSSQTGKPPLRITTGIVNMTGPGAYEFSLDGQGDPGSRMKIEGEVSRLDFPAFDRAIMRTTADCTALRQAAVYELLGIPLHENAFRLEPVDGVLSFDYTGGQLSLHGKIVSPAMSISTLTPFSRPEIDFAVRMDAKGESFTFDKVTAKAGEGVFLDAGGTLEKTDASWRLDTQIKGTALPAALLFGIIGRPDYRRAVDGLIHLQGHLRNASGWDFNGKMLADAFALDLLFPQEKGSLSADIQCSEATRQLTMTGIKLQLSKLQAGGEVCIPLGADEKHADLRIDLKGGLDLQSLKNAPAPFNRSQGAIQFRLDVSSKDPAFLDYVFALESEKGSRLLLPMPDAPVPADLGEIAALAKGRIPLSDWRFSIEQAYLRSTPANLEFKLLRTGDQARGVYAFQLSPHGLIPVIEQFLPAASPLAEGMLSLSGRGSILMSNAAISLPDASLKSVFTNEVTASIAGAFDYTPGSISGKKSELLVQRGGKTTLQANADFRFATAQEQAQEDLSLTFRGDLAQALEFCNNVGFGNAYTGSAAQAAASVRYVRTGNQANIAGAANLARLHLVQAGQPLLHMEPLTTLRLDATCRTDQKSWDIRSFTVAVGQTLFLLSAKGKLNLENGLSGQCQIDSDCELGEVLRFLPPGARPAATPADAPAAAAYEPFLRGRVKTALRLEGSTDAPELTFTASAPFVAIGPVTAPHTLTSPTLNGKINWRATPEGIRSIMVSGFLFRSANELFELKGQADAVRILDSARLDFGRGLACNFRLQSTRSLLALAFPRTGVLVRDQGKPDSLRLAGLVTATSLPLQHVFHDETNNLVIPDGIALRNGSFNLDELKTDYVSLKDISAAVSLADGKLKVEKGTGDLGGLIQFGLDIDFNARPAQARATTSGLNLNLPKCLSGLKIRTRFDDGKLSFPWPLSQQQIVATWQGLDLPSIRKTLRVPETGIHIDDMRLTTKLSMPDFYKMFSYDLPENLAREAADRMNAKFAERYANFITPHYKAIDLSFKVEDEVLTVTRCTVGGGNTADFELEGKLFLDGKLNTYLRPVKNMANTFDASVAMADPAVNKFILGLPADQQEKARGILPGWLEDAANKRKLAIHIIKDIDDPTIDPQDVRDRIKAELPYIMEKIASVLDDKDLMRGILGKDGAKDVTNILNNLNR